MTWTIRTGDDGGVDDDPGIAYCLSPAHCFAPRNALNWNDRDVRSVDVWHLDGLGLTRADIDRITIRYPSTDAWSIACVQVAIDGETIHCAPAAATLDHASPEWSTAPTRACTTCWDAPLSHGPVVGGTSDHDARIWLRTDASRHVALHLATDPTALPGGAPVATAVPGPEDDFTHTFHVTGLQPATLYHYILVVDGVPHAPPDATAWRFRTAPPAGAPAAFSLGIGSCIRADVDKAPTQPAFAALDALAPDLFLFAGDNVYFDTYGNGEITDLAGARAFYREGLQRTYPWAASPPSARADFGRDARARFLATTPTFAVWDDHDFLHDNSYGVSSGVPNPNRVWARQAFVEYWPNPAHGEGDHGIYHRLAWGDVDVFMLDVRYFRDTDHTAMLGDAQRAWLFDGLARSTATFKLIVDGSDWSAEGISDSWAGWPVERDALLRFIVEARIEGVVLVSGDSHRSELRMLPGADGGYTLPHIVSSGLATTRRACPVTNEFFEADGQASCYGADTGAKPSFVVVAFDTTQPDPRLTATIHDEDGVARRDWSFTASALAIPTRAPLRRRDADFDGDGYADLAIGAPTEDGAALDDGLAHVLLGTSAGLHTAGHRAFTHAALVGASEAGARLGEALAHGDLDGDGFDELVIGAPGAPGSSDGAGRVVVLRGSATGLATDAEVVDPIEGGRFGAALAVGDFDGDGFDDVAIGAPDHAGGMVQILDGSPGALTLGARLDQATTGRPGDDEPGDAFGAALAVGDFDGDGFDDLAIGVPFEDRPSALDVGAVTVVYGGPLGLGARASDIIDPGGGDARPDARWGAALVAGDLDGDGVDDLVIGAPGAGGGAGRVARALGVSGRGLGAAGRSLGLEDLAPDLVESADDALGAALASGDFDGDGVADVAIGMPGRSGQRGAVVAWLGTGVTRVLSQDDTSWTIAGPDDRFGAALAAADFDADGLVDLAVGAPGDDVGPIQGAGVVDVFFGRPDGFDAPRPLTDPRATQRWHQALVRIDGAGSIEANDGLGASLGR
ncbi:MAG: FG-GAP repeat protein [Deltaproteobacteria bacterium]|nr:FG-GAP repeat protein [Deltaproteobacteria bacterium]